ncbi:MAG: hypothetical protein H8E40_07540 [Chloroflexi bacterium]|nr:hypothetical protein [Chloroflexota bacterium]
MKEVYKGYLRGVDTVTGTRLFLCIGDVVVPVEKMFEKFNGHNVRITIEDIREPKERALDCFRDIEVVPQVSMAAPI